MPASNVLIWLAIVLMAATVCSCGSDSTEGANATVEYADAATAENCRSVAKRMQEIDAEDAKLVALGREPRINRFEQSDLFTAAASHNCTNEVAAMLEAGTDPKSISANRSKAEDSQRFYALGWALYNDNTIMADMLRQRGATSGRYDNYLEKQEKARMHREAAEKRRLENEAKVAAAKAKREKRRLENEAKVAAAKAKREKREAEKADKARRKAMSPCERDSEDLERGDLEGLLGRVMTHDCATVAAALYAGRADYPDSDFRILLKNGNRVDAVIFAHSRSKLDAFESVARAGYRMTPESRAYFRKAVFSTKDKLTSADATKLLVDVGLLQGEDEFNRVLMKDAVLVGDMEVANVLAHAGVASIPDRPALGFKMISIDESFDAFQTKITTSAKGHRKISHIALQGGKTKCSDRMPESNYAALA